MGEHSTFSEHPASPTHESPEGAALRGRLAGLAELGRVAATADLLIIEYDVAGEAIAGADRRVRAPRGPSRRDQLGAAVMAALAARMSADRRVARGLGDDEAEPIEFTLGAADVAASLARVKATGDTVTLAALGLKSEQAAVSVAAIAGGDPAPAEVKAAVQLVAHAALAELRAAEAQASRGFWRERAAEAAAKAKDAGQALGEADAAQRELDDAVAAASALSPRKRFDGLGELVARIGSFDAWIVALAERGELKAVAASSPAAVGQSLGADSALGDCFERRRVVARAAKAGRGFAEDRVLRAPYVCIPFEAGAIALASRGTITPAVRARTEALVARLSPIVKTWAVEAEAAAYRSLVGRLALRMFSAIDEERARIARDLHDDEAQLLAAAKIALEGGRDEARAIFGQLEQELRGRTRALRPASLGGATLVEALERELERLSAAGIDARVERLDGANLISRGLQQLCYQVAREALSNVLRHAAATSVRITIGRDGGVARIAIMDNGRGLSADARDPGTGLAGLSERLELMGGRLTIDSRPGATKVVAEIPEPA